MRGHLLENKQLAEALCPKSTSLSLSWWERERQLFLLKFTVCRAPPVAKVDFIPCFFFPF